VGERPSSAHVRAVSPPPASTPQRDDVRFVGEDIEDVLNAAKRVTRKNIWIEGGANVAQQFIERRLIDEMVLSVAPVILGDGIRLFGQTNARIELSLRETKTFDKGLVQLMYARRNSNL
jgi:dihydrofolate reductase